jgi:hypothetical protein
MKTILRLVITLAILAALGVLSCSFVDQVSPVLFVRALGCQDAYEDAAFNMLSNENLNVSNDPERNINSLKRIDELLPWAESMREPCEQYSCLKWLRYEKRKIAAKLNAQGHKVQLPSVPERKP